MKENEEMQSKLKEYEKKDKNRDNMLQMYQKKLREYGDRDMKRTRKGKRNGNRKKTTAPAWRIGSLLPGDVSPRWTPRSRR